MRLGISLVSMLALVLAIGCSEDNGPTSSGANHAPVIRPQNDTLLAVGDTLELSMIASYADEDQLTYGVTVELTLAEIKQGYWPHVHMDAHTGDFWFRAAEEDRPRRRFTVSVEDGRGGADSTTFSVTVN
jgi:hypothetical protein